MYSICFIIFLNFVFTNAFYLPDRLRHKRQNSRSAASQYTARPRPLELPAGYKPFPDSSATDSLAPTFPLAHTYSNGVDVNQGNIGYTEGTLNVPIPGWGMWDLKGREIFGPQTTWFNYGHLVQPVNMYNMTPSEINDMISSPGYQAARDK